MKLSAPIGQTQAATSLLLFIGAIFVVLCSLSLQHIGGYTPCKLCYVQREVHYALIPLSGLLVLATWRNWPATLVRVFFLLLAAVILYGAGVGVYQAGAEWEFWLGPNDCTNSVNITQSAGNLLSQLQSTKLVSCTVPQLRILGLSFAGWNAVLSSALTIIALAGAFLAAGSLADLISKIPVLSTLAAKINSNQS